MDITQLLSESSGPATSSPQLVEQLGWLALARRYEISQPLLLRMADQLSQLPLEAVLTAIQSWEEGSALPGIPAEQQDYFPTVRQLRLATCLISTGSTTEQAWTFVVGYLNRHGTDGHASSRKTGERPARPGSSIMQPMFEAIEAPKIPLEIVKALEGMGAGDMKRGMTYVKTHPFFVGWEEAYWGRESPHRVAEVIERSFRREYEKAVLCA